MNECTKHFLREKFTECYLEYSIQLPPGFESQKWGCAIFDGLARGAAVMARCMNSLGSAEEPDRRKPRRWLRACGTDGAAEFGMMVCGAVWQLPHKQPA